jgi:hypothetical protein
MLKFYPCESFLILVNHQKHDEHHKIAKEHPIHINESDIKEYLGII